MEAKDFCTHAGIACADILQRHIKVTLDGNDSNGKPIKKEVGLRDVGTAATLDVALAEFLGQTVTLTMWYRHPKTSDEIPWKTISVKVENLGLVTSFPARTTQPLGGPFPAKGMVGSSAAAMGRVARTSASAGIEWRMARFSESGSRIGPRRYFNMRDGPVAPGGAR